MSIALTYLFLLISFISSILFLFIFYLFILGVRYSGTSRVAFLPDIPEGRSVAEMLRICFQRRLTFTVGRSLTTGGIHIIYCNDNDMLYINKQILFSYSKIIFPYLFPYWSISLSSLSVSSVLTLV